MAGSNSVQLLSNASVTGDSLSWAGGDATFSVSGNFSGATVSLQALCPDEVTWFDCGPGTIRNTPGFGNVYLAATRVRVAVSGGAPSGLDAQLVRIIS